MAKTVKDAMALAKDAKCTMADLKFCDFLGVWQHFSVPVAQLKDGEIFEDGLGFDGSSIRGWQAINASDMLVIPDPDSAVIDPFIAESTISLICNIVDPITREPYTRDPRNIARKATAYLQSTGIGDTAFFGPEAEFFIFDDIRYANRMEESFYSIDSEEGAWNTGTDEGPNLGHKPRTKEGYFPVSPVDSQVDLRNEMVKVLLGVGIDIEASHHEVATAGQAEIDMRFSPLVKMADNLMWFKYVCKNVAARNGKTVTFMPKPLFGDNGSGMHVHQSIWKGGVPLFAGNGYGGTSEMCMYYIGGLLKHAKALSAFTNPTTNSYKRLVPGYEAPVNLAYSSRNRSAAIRIPMYSASPKAKRIEARFPDPACNGYISFAALLMAGLDGIQHKIDPGDPLDKDIYSLTPEELEGVPTMPPTLPEALNHLREDHEFLLKGNVFTQDVIDMWIDWKYNRECLPVMSRPVPMEFELYYDC